MNLAKTKRLYRCPSAAGVILALSLGGCMESTEDDVVPEATQVDLRHVDSDGITLTAEPISDRYIVVLAEPPQGLMLQARAATASLMIDYGGDERDVRHVYDHGLRGFSATMTRDQAIAMRSDPRVLSIHEDGVSRVMGTQSNPANWGLDRIDATSGLDNSYTYRNTASSVHAYIVDTGIRNDHTQFTGRIGNGWSVMGQTCSGGNQTIINTVNYSATGTSNATTATVNYNISLTGGTAYTFDTCGTGTTDTYLRLYQGSTQVASNDDSGCSNYRSTITFTPASTATYTLKMGCYNNSSCSGPVNISVPAGQTCTANTEDQHGHGTHVSGIVGGTTYGVAKGVTIHPIRVYEFGEGPESDVMAGLDWVAANVQYPAVVNMSVGGALHVPQDDLIRSMIANDNINFVFASGNDTGDACNYSPSEVTTGLTVGNVDSSDTRVYDSNYGSCVDLHAPGEVIRSAGYQSSTGIDDLSGTSQAAPHVTGAVALYLQEHPSASPATVHAAIVNGASTDCITFQAGKTAANRLLDATLAGGSCAAPPPPPGGGSCSSVSYSAASTNNASYTDVDTVQYNVDLSAGVSYTFSTCGKTTTDTYLRLHFGGVEKAQNDDNCGGAYQSKFTYTPSTSGVYVLSLGCYSNNSCSSVVDISAAANSCTLN